MKTGVYQILNLLTGQRYVGSTTKSFNHRWSTHRVSLREGSHRNQYLQRAWGKYGESLFEFSVLEYCSKEQCLNLEQYWMDLFRSYERDKGYNLAHLAASRLGMKTPGTSSVIQDIYVFTLKGERVDYFTKTVDAAIELFGDYNYYKGISTALSGKKKSYRSYVFSKLPAFPGYKKNCVGRGKWSAESIRKAALTRTGKKRPDVSKFMKGRRRPMLYVPVEQWKDGKLLKLWPSQIDAARELNICKTTLGFAVQGKRPSAGGYQWKYKTI